METSQTERSIGSVAGASLIGVGIAWLAYVLWAAATTFTQEASRDIAMAMFPAATLISALVALLLFWPLSIAASWLGLKLAGQHGWARQWTIWLAAGAVLGALTLTLFIGVISSWSAEVARVSPVGALVGAAVALITHWRMGVGRLA